MKQTSFSFSGGHDAGMPIMHKALLVAAALFFLLSLPLSAHAKEHVMSGKATWYGTTAHGKLTANGETFNRYDLTAAHLTLPFGTVIRVHNQSNGKDILVRVTDRGPFGKGRVVDMSYRSAQLLDMTDDGVVPVVMEIVAGKDGRPFDANNSFYLHLANEQHFQRAHEASHELQTLTGLPVRALLSSSEESPAFMLCAGPYSTFKEAEDAFLKVEQVRPVHGVIEAPTIAGEAPAYALTRFKHQSSPRALLPDVQAAR
jgi:rare lipoprotein A